MLSTISVAYAPMKSTRATPPHFVSLVLGDLLSSIMRSGPNARICTGAMKHFERRHVPPKTEVARGCARSCMVVPEHRRQRRPARHSSQGRGLARGDFIGAQATEIGTSQAPSLQNLQKQSTVFYFVLQFGPTISTSSQMSKVIVRLKKKYFR